MLDRGFRHGLPALILLASLACSGEPEDKPKPSGERTHEPVPETPKDAPSGPFAKFDFASAADRWQGDWVVAGASAERKLAWHVAGDRVTQAGQDGQEANFRFAVYSPCQVGYTDDEAGETTFANFAFAEGRLHVGLGATGVALGETTLVVCDGDGQVYVLEGAQCSKWSEMFDDWKRSPGKCSVEGEGAARRFVVGETRLRFVGDALLDDSMIEQVASKHADFAAAKAALAAQPGAPSTGGQP
ncbi:hypothetical protein ACNOYE_27200 [Nannocystaceae bacterium ST9]